MYQSIDDIDETDVGQPRSNLPLIAWLIAALALLAIGAAVYNSQPDIGGTVTSTAPNGEARKAYIKALGETNPAMRRARLQDFQRTHPNSARADAVRTQLDVINLHDSEAWNMVTQVYYNERLAPEDKLAVLERYNSEWGGALLGGRSDEIETLRTALNQLPEDVPEKPSRKRENVFSPIPKNIEGDNLLGGPRRMVTFVPTPPPPPPVQIVKDPNKGVIAPTVRKDVKPKYPSRAWRKKIPGVVTLRLDIDQTGQVVSTELVSVKARRYEKNFVKVSERAAMKTRYFPKVVDGKPVPAKGIIKRYTFERD